MDYRNEIKEFLTEFEKKFNISLEDFNWVEQRLGEVYWYGYDDGQKTRSEDDYEEGYRSGRLEGRESWENDD